ncbi:ricin-type beta-trefoil lectin domain protein [Streptomyces sp. NPDC052077]|uniref:RICIN domain-containing protein n=1 Tax=Streptomyces sp. NPDC052077 TaxID=3154757 RepID=UPI00342CD8B6
MGKRTKRLMAVLGASAVLLAGTAGSAGAVGSGTQAVGFQLKNVQTGRCLDSNYNGEVYTSPCAKGGDNPYQQWQWGYWGVNALRNVETGLCLQNIAGDRVTTYDCDGTSEQIWSREYPVANRETISNKRTWRGLDSNANGQAYTSPYSTTNPYMQWWEW